MRLEIPVFTGLLADCQDRLLASERIYVMKSIRFLIAFVFLFEGSFQLSAQETTVPATFSTKPDSDGFMTIFNL